MMKVPAMEAVVRVIESEGVDTVFGIPGAAILPLYHALQESNIRHLTVRHEEGGTHAADGWARVTGNVGVCIGTSGPAGTNMITGLYTAQADSIPIICITGQAPRAKLHQEAFQAVDIVDIARPVTKWAVQLKEAAQAPWIFREAFRVARSDRPGPVLIDIPLDVAVEHIPYDPDVDGPFDVIERQPNPSAVRRAMDMIAEAERPLILAGGGVIQGNATSELRALAEQMQLPVSVTLMGKGALPEHHPLFAGMAGLQTQTRWGNQVFLESDLVVAVGARFGDRHTGDLDTYRQGRKFIHIDVEPTQIGKVFPPDLGIVGHARETLQALHDQANQFKPSRPSGDWVDRVRSIRESLHRRDDFDDVPIKAPRVFREVNAFFGEDTIYTTAIGLYQIWSGQFQQTFLPRRYLVCGQAGPLGWEVPAAIGAKLARPDTQVVAVAGDYSFQFLAEEVAVAAQYRVPFVILLINNIYLGLIRQSEIAYDMNFAVDLNYDENGVDHVKLMESFGCPARRVITPDQLRPSLEWAVATSNDRQLPVMVEVMIEREGNAAMGKSLDAIVEFEPLPSTDQAEALVAVGTS